MIINYSNEEALSLDFEKEYLNYMKECAELAFSYLALDSFHGEISLTFVNSEEIKVINRDYRNIDKETDVLSFPQYENCHEIPLEDENTLLGDIIISVDAVKKQAEEFNHSIKREVLYLFTHSIFHLLGLDHMNDEDKEKMRSAEKYVMDKIGIYK